MFVAAAIGGPLYLFTSPGQSLERPAERVAGPARVIDGDTIVVGQARIRLEGIDAPELAQSCPHPYPGRWNAGRRSQAALRRLIASRDVTCISHGTDRYGRMLGICTAGGTELNREMVARGYAWAFVRYSRRYERDEADARRARAGVWQKPCQPAWDYRRTRWGAEASGAPEGCAIKGNISPRGERVYHMPWGKWYPRVKIDLEKGERWFCNERDAIAAGWRASRA